MADNISALRTSREAPSLFEQLRTSPQLTPEAQYRLTDGASDTQFSRGLRIGAAGLSAGSFANQALSQELSGDADWEQSRDSALQIQEQAQMYAPRVSSLRDIRSFEDAGDFAAGAFGQGVMSMAPTLATALLTRGRGGLGAATGFGGAAVTAYNLERGEAALGQYADPTLAATSVEDRDVAATAKSVINAGLESIVPAGLAGSILRKPATSFLGGVSQNAVTEGVTEAAQQGVGFGAEKYLDPSRQLDPVDIADAFAAGALTGGGMSAVTAAPAAAANALVSAQPQAPTPAPEPEVLPNSVDSKKDFVADMIDRMREAAGTASTPAEFLQTVFRGGSEEAAAADLLPDTEDPTVLKAADPAAALQERDAQRLARAATFAEELLNDPATPAETKARVAELNGDYSDPQAQKFIARSLVAQRAGEKMATAVNEFISAAKGFGTAAGNAIKDAGIAAVDRIVKKSLQSTSPSEQAALDRLVFTGLTDEAKANPEVRSKLSELSTAMLAFTLRSRAGKMTQAERRSFLRAHAGLAMFSNPDATIAQLTKYLGVLPDEDSALPRTTSAQQDIRQQNSFLYTALSEQAKDSLTQPQLQKLARVVDEFTLTDSGSKSDGDQMLAGLTAAFGSKESAAAVLDYYRQQNRAELRPEFDVGEDSDSSALTETDAPPAAYTFKDAKARRPFFSVARVDKSEARKWGIKESTRAMIEERTKHSVPASMKAISYREYAEKSGLNLEQEADRIAADISKRIDGIRPGTESEKTRMALEGELDLFNYARSGYGAEGALDLYEVLETTAAKQDTSATDENLAAFGALLSRKRNPTSAEIKEANDLIDKTRITFQRTDGTKLALSAESMWKSQGDLEGSGGGESNPKRIQRLFKEALAAVLERPDIAGIVGIKTTPERTIMGKDGKERKIPAQHEFGPDLIIDRKSMTPARPKRNFLREAATTEALRKAGDSLKGLSARLKETVREVGELLSTEQLEPDAEARIDEIKSALERNIAKQRNAIEDLKNEAAEKKIDVAGASAVYRERGRLYQEALSEIHALEFEAEVEREALMGEDSATQAQIGSRIFDEWSTSNGARYAEEDTGLGIGVEKRGSTPAADAKTPQQPSAKPLRNSAPIERTIDPLAKMEPRTKTIGRGTVRTAAQERGRMRGTHNSGVYNAEDVVYAQSLNFAELTAATRSGAEIRTLPRAERTRNPDAREVAVALANAGYKEQSDGVWLPRSSVAPTGTQSSREDTLSTEQLKPDAEAEKAAKQAAARNAPRPQSAIDALHAKISPEELAKLRKSAAGATAAPETEWGDKKAATDEIFRLRGKDVTVKIEKLVSELGGSGQYSFSRATGERMIEIAVNAHSMLGTARHEAMHDFFQFLSATDATRSAAKDLKDATSAMHVMKQLRDLLEAHPEAIAQLNDPEERAAYAYQFWAEGQLRIGPTGTGIFGKIRKFIKDLFGVVTAEDRAESLLRAFHDGKFADPSTVQEVLQDLADKDGTTFRDRMNRAAPLINKVSRVLFEVAPNRLRALENAHISRLADLFSPEDGAGGFIMNRFQQQGVWENKLCGILAGTTAVERREAVEQLQNRKPVSALAVALSTFNKDIYQYMHDAGVQTWDHATERFVRLRQVKNYFVRAWDPDAIAQNRAEFIQLLMSEGGMHGAAAIEAADNLIRGGEPRVGPKETKVDLGFTPYAPHTAERVFTFINNSNAGKFAKFQQKDLADIMTSYVRGATHRAEYARAFGNTGQKIAELVMASGITDDKELEMISNAVQAMEGSLDPGKWSNKVKEVMSGIRTLENLVVLPLTIVSQMIDPVVIASRTGDVRDAGRAYITAIKRLVLSVKKAIGAGGGKNPDGEELAEMLGIISRDATLQAMSMAYGATYMSKRMENINRIFFKYNGMQGWNNSMRVAATAAGERYLIANKGNAEALAELGLTPADIVLQSNRLDVSSPKVQQAMFQFVDQAVLRPSAANRPVWMSDPRFLLVAHLKQFTFAMHNVVLKRANRELANDNPKPWAILALAMPVILAADMAKYALTGTGSMANWGFTKSLGHAIERSGLLGISDFGVQFAGGVEVGKMPGEGLLGPAFSHLMLILRWILGDARTDFGDVVDRTVPGAKFV